MTLRQSALPGLFSPAAQATGLESVDPRAAIRLVATILLSTAQHVVCLPDGSALDRATMEDPRYKTAVSQAVTLSIGTDPVTAARASDRNAFLTHHLRLRGKAGCAGLLAQAALLLGQAVQAANDPALPVKALDFIEQAIVRHALKHGADPREARAECQLRILNALNGLKAA